MLVSLPQSSSSRKNSTSTLFARHPTTYISRALLAIHAIALTARTAPATHQRILGPRHQKSPPDRRVQRLQYVLENAAHMLEVTAQAELARQRIAEHDPLLIGADRGVAMATGPPKTNKRVIKCV